MKKNSYFLIFIVLLLIIFGIYLITQKSLEESEGQVEIGFNNKEKVDESKVNNKNNWEEFTKGEVVFKYPESIDADYVFLEVWPPTIDIISNIDNYPVEVGLEKGDFMCFQTPSTQSFPKRIYEKTINGREYCIKAVSEGAAGSTYTTYNYSTIFNGDLLTINFVLQFPNCSNYPEIKKEECIKEREDFNINSIIAQIVETIPDTSLNYTREQAICDYLLTQREFGWKTGVNGRNFCVIENLGEKDSLFPLYIWARCSEFVFKNGELKEESVSTLPLKVNYPNELSFYDLDRFSYSIPRDGSGWGDDVREMFPKSVQEKIFNFQKKGIEEINKKLETKALNWFKNN